MAVAYNYGYYEGLSIPLIELKKIMPNAIERYKRIILIQKVLFKYFGIDENII